MTNITNVDNNKEVTYSFTSNSESNTSHVSNMSMSDHSDFSEVDEDFFKKEYF